MADTIKLEWMGRAYFVRDRMRARCLIESVYPVAVLGVDLPKGTPNRSALSCAWGGVLRQCGGQQSDEEIYDSLFGDDAADLVSSIANQLLSILIPQKISAGVGEPQEANPTPPSKTSTKSRLAKAG